jgi:hypothetical protein
MQRLTVLAVIVLVADAVFLGAMGVVAHRPLLVAGAVLAIGFAALMLALYRRHLRNWETVTRARQDLAAEVRAMARQAAPRRDS